LPQVWDELITSLMVEPRMS